MTGLDVMGGIDEGLLLPEGEGDLAPRSLETEKSDTVDARAAEMAAVDVLGATACGLSGRDDERGPKTEREASARWGM